MSYKEDSRKFDYYEKLKVVCKCGHSITFPVFIDAKICGWCGHVVYRTEKIEFKEKLKKYLKGVNK